MMTFAHAQKYFETILALICDCSSDSSKNEKSVIQEQVQATQSKSNRIALLRGKGGRFLDPIRRSCQEAPDNPIARKVVGLVQVFIAVILQQSQIGIGWWREP